MSDSTAVLVRTHDDPFTDPERLALAGYVAGYSGLTREAYALDLPRADPIFEVIEVDAVRTLRCAFDEPRLVEPLVDADVV